MPLSSNLLNSDASAAALGSTARERGLRLAPVEHLLGLLAAQLAAAGLPRAAAGQRGPGAAYPFVVRWPFDARVRFMERSTRPCALSGPRSQSQSPASSFIIRGSLSNALRRGLCCTGINPITEIMFQSICLL